MYEFANYKTVIYIIVLLSLGDENGHLSIGSIMYGQCIYRPFFTKSNSLECNADAKV